MENARRLLETLPARICDAGGHAENPDGEVWLSGFHWSNENVDRTLADETRIQVLVVLTKLAEH